MRTILLLVVMVLCTFTTNAQTLLAEYNFDASNLAPTTVATGLVSASNLVATNVNITGFGNGVTGIPDMAPYFNQWPSAPVSIDPSKYLEVTITANVGTIVQVDRIRVWERFMNNGPSVFTIRSSADGFSTNTYQNGSGSASFWEYHSLSIGPFVISNGGSVSFRLYAGATNSNPGSTFSVDSIHFEGMDITTLPVELLYFDGVETESGPLLEWATATEENNSHFTLERSLDQSSWELVTNMPGAGNSIGQIDYSYLDREAKVGWNYYRLTQTDYDGEHEVFGQIVPVHFSGRNELVYPNPGRVGETINVPNGSIIVDQSGRMVLTGVSQFVPSAPGIYLVGRQKLLIE